MRLWIRAAEVILSLTPPRDSSALNVLPATVAAIVPEGPTALIQLRLPGGAALLAVVALVLWVMVLGASPVAAEPAAGRWQWPSPSPHQVLHGFEQPEHRYAAGHRGVDLAAPDGAPVRAPVHHRTIPIPNNALTGPRTTMRVGQPSGAVVPCLSIISG